MIALLLCNPPTLPLPSPSRILKFKGFSDSATFTRVRLKQSHSVDESPAAWQGTVCNSETLSLLFSPDPGLSQLV